MWAKSFISHNKPKNSQALAHILEGKCALPFYRITPILRLIVGRRSNVVPTNRQIHCIKVASGPKIFLIDLVYLFDADECLL